MLSFIYQFLLLPLAFAIAINGQVGTSDVLLGGLDLNLLPQHQTQFHVQDMLITNVNTLSLNTASGEQNRGIAFDWADPMSNTSNHCTATWLEQTDGSGYPVDFVRCDKTGHEEIYMWRFTYYGRYKNGGHAFVLDLFHAFKDPLNLLAPWDIPVFFARAAVHLTCIAVSGTKACYLPLGSKIVEGVVYATAY